MSLLDQLQIDLVYEAQYLASLLANAGNQNNKEIIKTLQIIRHISTEGILEARWQEIDLLYRPEPLSLVSIRKE